MILTCLQCGTRFQLDERRIPSRGARVRCSKCNHGFFVRPPEVEAETTLQGIVAETVAEAIPAPEPELEGDAPDQLDVTNPELSEAMEPVGEVPPDQWTFDDELPDPTAVPQPAEASPAIDEAESPFGEAYDLGGEDPLAALAREVAWPMAPTAATISEAGDLETAESKHAEGGALEGLGDPAEWDFLEDPVPAAPPEAKLAEPVEEATKPVAAARRVPTLPPRLKAWAASAAGGVGWVLCVGLILGGLGQAFRAVLAPVAPAPFLQAGAGSLEVRDLVARNLENLQVGPILVVSGVVAPRRSGPTGLRVQLLDAEGRPLEGAEAWAGPVVAEQALREHDPRRLRADQATHSEELVFGGVFDAIFWPVPSGARGVAVRPAARSGAATGLLRPPSPSPSPE